MGLAAYAAELITFLLGLWFYKRVGYNSSILFLAHFDWDVVKTSFKFGVFEMLGSAAWSFGRPAEIAITQALINYAEIGELGPGSIISFSAFTSPRPSTTV